MFHKILKMSLSSINDNNMPPNQLLYSCLLPGNIYYSVKKSHKLKKENCHFSHTVEYNRIIVLPFEGPFEGNHRCIDYLSTYYHFGTLYIYIYIYIYI